MATDIKQFPILPSVIITVFKSVEKMRIDSTNVCYGDCIDTEFSNTRISLFEQKILCLNNESHENKLKKFLKEINFEYDKNLSVFQVMENYLKEQGYDTNLNQNRYMASEKIWIIYPDSFKKLSGEKIRIQFSLPPENLKKYQPYKVEELDVFMTKITPEVKSIKFSVYIPDYIYNKCMENTDIDIRPKLRYIESESLSSLHNQIATYSDLAINTQHLQESSEKYKKKIAIIFNSNEEATRDNYNHAYTGQSISVNFRYYVVNEFGQDSLSHNYDYFTFKKRISINDKIRQPELKIETTLPYIDLESKNQKVYFYGRPSGTLIDWTEEREKFCQELESKFRNLSNNLNQFLKDLDSEKLDNLIQNNTLKLLG
jgi:hypothetical protein